LESLELFDLPKELSLESSESLLFDLLEDLLHIEF
jgi:hypothetical protein